MCTYPNAIKARYALRISSAATRWKGPVLLAMSNCGPTAAALQVSSDGQWCENLPAPSFVYEHKLFEQEPGLAVRGEGIRSLVNLSLLAVNMNTMSRESCNYLSLAKIRMRSMRNDYGDHGDEAESLDASHI